MNETLIKNKVRQRTTYKFWFDLLKELKKSSMSAMLFRIWQIIDDRRGFGSERNAFINAQSLALVLDDNRLTSTKIKGVM